MAKAKTVTRTVYVKKKRRNGKKHTTIPLSVAFPAIYAAGNAVYNWKNFGWDLGSRLNIKAFTGFNPKDGKFDFAAMQFGTLPLVYGIAVHWVANRVGINRALASMRIPLIRL